MKILSTNNFKKIAQQMTVEDEEVESGPQREVRFRGSIYADIFVPETQDLENDRKVAKDTLEEYAREIPNAYVGGVALYDPHNLFNPFDREI